MSASRELLLVGAGHTHLHLVSHAAELRAAGYHVRLLAPALFHYSGTASATVGGGLPTSAGTIDVPRLCAVHDVEHHDATMTGVDRDAKVVATSSGTRLDYDVVSINIGSVVADPTNHGGGRVLGSRVVRVKPLSDLTRLDDLLRARAPAVVTVVGAGTTGVEMAAQLSTRADVRLVRLLGTSTELAPALPGRARTALARLLRARAVEVRLSTDVANISDRHVEIEDGTRLGHDVVVVATGLTAPPAITDLGLGTTRGIPVRATLQHADDDDVYAVGDCAHFVPQPLPRVGVHGVRQAPVLLDSLLCRSAGVPLPVYEPRRHALAVLDLGDGTGLAARGRWWWHGASALRLKRHLDHRWLRRYQLGP